jgi:hypothetical protein
MALRDCSALICPVGPADALNDMKEYMLFIARDTRSSMLTYYQFDDSHIWIRASVESLDSELPELPV